MSAVKNNAVKNNTVKNNTSTNSYVPPSIRQAIKTTALSSTQKKEPKKEFSTSDQTLFPSLGETLKRNNNNPLSFSSAASRKTEPPKVVKAEVAPGWVNVRKHNGRIEYKYGASIPKDNKRTIKDAIVLGNILFKYRLAKEQYERDMDILRLGDLSEFYGEPTLAELYENDMETMQQIEDENSSAYGESDVETF
jgi:hypothetical protein